MGTSLNNLEFMLDEATILHDGAAALTASGAGQVSSAAKVLDVGAEYVEGKVIVDVSAIALTTDELYTFAVQGTNVAAFATAAVIYDLCKYELGAGEVLTAATAGNDVGEAGGRYVIPFTNQVYDTTFRYLRLYVTTAGAAETITFKAYLVPA